eukprot:SAG22_NODE_7345_length_749_cov_1.335385_1_plen_71_part_01
MGCKALPLPGASTVCLSKTVPFHVVSQVAAGLVERSGGPLLASERAKLLALAGRLPAAKAVLEAAAAAAAG